MDEIKIVKMYVDEKYTLRHISEIFNSNHHTIKRVLLKHDVEITKRKTLKEYTDEHRKKISETSKGRPGWSKGLKLNRDHVLKNMMVHLKYDVTFEWLSSFDSVEKLKYINRALRGSRCCGEMEAIEYMNLIEKFYYDKKFNLLFDKWIKTGDSWIKPSIDHIIPVSKGGTNELSNLRIISWLENKIKSTLDYNEWEKIKIKINEYF